MFLFFFVPTWAARGCGARQCSLLFSCFLWNCSFLLQAESDGCNSTFLLLCDYSPLPLMVPPVIITMWVRNVEGEVWKGPGCMHESRANFAIHTQSLQPCSSLPAANWKWSSLCAQRHSCWISPSQLLAPLPIVLLSWREEPHSVLTALKTQKSRVEHLLIVELALGSQDSKTAHFLWRLVLEPPGVRVCRAFPARFRQCWRGRKAERKGVQSHNSSDFSGWGCKKTDNKCCGIDYRIWQSWMCFCPSAE